MPLIIRWPVGAAYKTLIPTTAGVTFGVNNAAGRTYLGIGSDNTTADQNYNNFTPQSLKLFMNEVQRYAPLASGVNNIKLNTKLVIVKDHCIEIQNDANSVSVINAVGTIFSTHNNVIDGTSISLIHNGMYLVKVKSAQGIEIQKINFQ